MEAILTDHAHGLTLDSITTRLREEIAADADRCELLSEPGAPPICPPHLRLVWRETDFGQAGEWWVLIFLETGDEIQQDNQQCVAQSKNVCPDPDGVRNADTRVRMLFSDDPDQQFTNTTIALMSFLQALPASIVYDPQQSEFVI